MFSFFHVHASSSLPPDSKCCCPCERNIFFFFFSSANGREQFLSKNNTKIICLRVYKILEGFFSFLHLGYYFFPQVSSTLHKYGWIYSDCSSIWKEIDPVQPYRRWAWHRQEEEPHQPYWYACLCLNKDDAQALALLKRSSGTCFSSFPGSFWVFAAARAN